jgi:hypothetical protein
MQDHCEPTSGNMLPEVLRAISAILHREEGDTTAGLIAHIDHEGIVGIQDRCASAMDGFHHKRLDACKIAQRVDTSKAEVVSLDV